MQIMGAGMKPVTLETVTVEVLEGTRRGLRIAPPRDVSALETDGDVPGNGQTPPESRGSPPPPPAAHEVLRDARKARGLGGMGEALGYVHQGPPAIGSPRADAVLYAGRWGPSEASGRCTYGPGRQCHPEEGGKTRGRASNTAVSRADGLGRTRAGGG